MKKSTLLLINPMSSLENLAILILKKKKKMKLYIMMQSMNLDICFFKAKNNLKINKRQENVKN